MYISLFISAFLAATILPAQSEALLAYQVSIAPDLVLKLVAIATAGNVLGAIVNWWLGKLTANVRQKSWFPVSEKKLLKGELYYKKFGRYSLLLSWVPFIGDPITVVAGILREPLWSFIILVTISKCTRYLVVVGLVSTVFA
ncbi:YqaA family protein [Candidatus Puniceispirillum sp.]|uniref:YqaA family protein n=1 Tax=Candidatus Puniceispirillum sp. TaxID=2026719 RepID=UPI003F695084